ncbi:MAG: hypothetical protein HGB23_11590 [Chlorobiaceae bacterium]|nr:hypothetical protein [Chlorobiaceae bacterium]
MFFCSFNTSSLRDLAGGSRSGDKRHGHELRAGEILLNCIDKDGTNSGFDLELINQVRSTVSIPVIASSGAGKVEHFSEVFKKTRAEAALATGIFPREEVPISELKAHLRERGIEMREIFTAFS